MDLNTYSWCKLPFCFAFLFTTEFFINTDYIPTNVPMKRYTPHTTHVHTYTSFHAHVQVQIFSPHTHICICIYGVRLLYIYVLGITISLSTRDIANTQIGGWIRTKIEYSGITKMYLKATAYSLHFIRGIKKDKWHDLISDNKVVLIYPLLKMRTLSSLWTTSPVHQKFSLILH